MVEEEMAAEVGAAVVQDKRSSRRGWGRERKGGREKERDKARKASAPVWWGGKETTSGQAEWRGKGGSVAMAHTAVQCALEGKRTRTTAAGDMAG